MTLSAPESSEVALSPFAKVAECLYRHRSSGTYYGLVKRSGKQFRRSLRTTDRQLANRRLSEFRSKLGIGLHSRETSRLSFSDLVKRWLPIAVLGLKPKSRLRKEGVTEQLKKYFGTKPVRNITKGDCDTWATDRSAKRSASTYNNERETLQAIFTYAQREGMIIDNPASHLGRRKAVHKIPEIPTRDQFRRLVAEMRKLDQRAAAGADLVELLAYSGMRLSEAVNLRWRDVDFERGCFSITGGEQGVKNLEARVVPLFPSLRRFLEDKAVGPHAADDVVIGIGKARRSMDSAAKKAGLPSFTHHSLRHYFASNAIEAGIDFKVIASWLGHKDGGVLAAKTYGHLRDTHSFEMAKRMDFSASHE